MTTDDYTTAARAEAQRAYQDTGMPRYDLAVHMAEWARVYLSQQEPSDAEVEAAAEVLAEAEDTGSTGTARAAPRAARDVRGQNDG